MNHVKNMADFKILCCKRKIQHQGRLSPAASSLSTSWSCMSGRFGRWPCRLVAAAGSCSRAAAASWPTTVALEAVDASTECSCLNVLKASLTAPLYIQKAHIIQT